MDHNIEDNSNFHKSEAGSPKVGIGVFLVTNRKINSINKGFIVY